MSSTKSLAPSVLAKLLGDLAVVELPYLGAWTPPDASRGDSGEVVHDPPAKTPASRGREGSPEGDFDEGLTSLLLSLCFMAHPDSGCTGSMTPDRRRLINVRPCSETFSAASGVVSPATCIGDLPIVLRDDQGQLCLLIIRNVRCVPDFKFTLLSVTQMWEEQRISSKFDDVKALDLPCGRRFSFLGDRALPTIKVVSGPLIAPMGGGESPRPALATAAEQPPATPAAAPGSASEPPSGPAAASPPLLSARLPPPTRVTPEMHTHSAAEAALPIALPHAGPRVPAGRSSTSLGWHRLGSSSHVARLPAAQAAELMHRRSHMGVAKMRALHSTTSDAPKVLDSAPSVSCRSCAEARIKRSSHSGTLSAPAPEPGVLHFDIKEMVVSVNGYRYVVFLIDEFSRYVFFDFIKRKSEAAAAVARGIAAFNATVYTPVDDDGRPLPRPRVRELHSDREGGLMSSYFREFCASADLHHTTSPPHDDHDLNPIAERVIGLIAELSTAIRASSHAPAGYWPWIVAYAVAWHNASISAVGSSTADSNISPHQRLTLRPGKVMDLAAFGCRAVALKAPTHLHKPSLTTKGWVGIFLGRSRDSKGCYDVLVGNRVVSTSSVDVDEEHFDWAPAAERYRPLTSVTHAAPGAQPLPLQTGLPPAGADVSAPSTYTPGKYLEGGATVRHGLRFLSLFSGPYARADGLSAHLKRAGWESVEQIDNDGEHGGGWAHDLLNDATFSRLLARLSAGEYDALMIAFPCSTFAVTRLFDATDGDGGDRGPPIIRDYDHPDGLPEDEVDPKHRRELRESNKLLERVVQLAIAARGSPARTTIVVENPSDRSPGASIASAPEFKRHGSLFRTSAFKQLVAAADLASHATFAYCRLGSEYQKYTTLYYSPEAGSVLDALDGPDYKCNHPRGTHGKRAGGRGPDGKFVSADAAAYPEPLNIILSRAFTIARTGGTVVPRAPTTAGERRSAAQQPQSEQPDDAAQRDVAPVHPLIPPSSSRGGAPLSSSLGGTRALPPTPPSPVPNFPDLSAGPSSTRFVRQHPARDRTARDGPLRNPAVAFKNVSSEQARAKAYAPPASTLAPVEERVAGPSSPDSPVRSPGSSVDGYSPFQANAAVSSQPAGGMVCGDSLAALRAELSSRHSEAAAAMNAAVAESVFDATTSSSSRDVLENDLVPISDWVEMPPGAKRVGKRLPGGARVVEFDVAFSDEDGGDLLSSTRSLLAAFGAEMVRSSHSLLASVGHALRADSPGAPSTHAEAVARGKVWVDAELKELGNHRKNGSWVTITRDELPRGRRVHKLIWVYKEKRDGTAKARLCVQGTTLEEGVDYQQVFSAALRYSSARALFAYAARHGCGVRSVDLVAAYLQGRFVDGEVVYTHLPPGHPEFDSKGRPLLARVEKPIYGIQQAGRRLQRLLFEWIKEYGFVQHDDSDPCIFTLPTSDGEVLTLGLYVDNLQLVHSVTLDAKGRGPSGCAYNAFMDALASRWDITDEGPMEDLLGIEVQYNADGSIKLHQQKYIEKIVSRFLPDGPIGKAQRNSMPYSSDFLQHVNDALSQTECEHPQLVQPMQSRVGCLMYAATSTRPDVAYAVHQLCKCLHKPTPELLVEADHVLSYLSRTAELGLTYTREHMRLQGYADASWETAHSTSGWVVLWQSAALTWGSRKQKSIALSSCEAEIIALSEATKDVVYLRKLVDGLGAREPSPTLLRTDSQSARDVSYNPEHHDRMKHVERRHFFVRDMVESFEIEVPFVPTKENIADFFTKPMKSAAQFNEFRRIVMNIR